MSVGKLLRDSAGETSHAGTYTDLVRNVPRQYDYRAVWEQGDCIVQLAVECKNFSPFSPVVVCGGPRMQHESFHDFLAATKGVLKSHTVGGRVQRFAALTVRPSPLYACTDFVGKSLFRPESVRKTDATDSVDGYAVGGDSDVYDAYYQAISSAAEMCSAATKHNESRHKKVAYTATLPVVVMPEETLWQMPYGDDCQPAGEPSAVTHCTVFRDQSRTLEADFGTVNFRVSHVHLMTPSGLLAFIKTLETPGSTVWVDWFPQNIRNTFCVRFQ